MKTDTRIKDLLRAYILPTDLGKEFKDGKDYRVFIYAPNIDPSKEYMVLSVLDGFNAQIQTNVINANIYVPDIDNGTGNNVQNVGRIRTLSDIAAKTLNEVITPEYRFKLLKMPVLKVNEFGQHVINCKIEIEILNI